MTNGSIRPHSTARGIWYELGADGLPTACVLCLRPTRQIRWHGTNGWWICETCAPGKTMEDVA
ncbi:MAG TPA: hypothetical protein VM492_03500 [Sumerlaeia bacterium]|nr:hypothetical protein [Sumerlaeia bacterium]